jgi:EAL domain-containing protein (putative c-di-GMP-specific phosphodiesterase class I)
MVAEGVEDEATWQEQGYYLAKPRTPAQFATWLATQPTCRARQTAW